jgi:hypothetical protein
MLLSAHLLAKGKQQSQVGHDVHEPQVAKHNAQHMIEGKAVTKELQKAKKYSKGMGSGS